MIWLSRNWEIPATVIVIALLALVCSIGLNWAEAKGEARSDAKWQLKELHEKLHQADVTLKLTRDNAAAANTYAQAVISREREWVTITGRLRNEISKPIYRDCAITNDARLLHDAAVGDRSGNETGDSTEAVPAPDTPIGQ